MKTRNVQTSADILILAQETHTERKKTMADIKWIKITTDIFSDEKILLIEQLPDADTIIVIWFKLLCMAGRDNNNGIFVMNNRMPYTEEMLATLFRRPLNTVRLALATFEAYGMIDIVDDVFTIPNWEKHQNIDGMDKIREQNRLRKQRQREKQKQALLEDSHVTMRDCHATDKDKEKDKDKEYINTNSASDNAPSKQKISKSDINTFFETVWKLYPNKKGKGQISDSKKKALYEIGLEELTRAIERYKSDLEKEEWRKAQNGSTFFNSGYIDYLDANYTPLQTKPQAKKNGFNNINQRTYEYDALERNLLASQNAVMIDSDPQLQAEANELKKMLQDKY